MGECTTGQLVETLGSFWHRDFRAVSVFTPRTINWFLFCCARLCLGFRAQQVLGSVWLRVSGDRGVKLQGKSAVSVTFVLPGSRLR